MDVKNEMPIRIKMGLLRQQQVDGQSTEKTSLENRDEEMRGEDKVFNDLKSAIDINKDDSHSPNPKIPDVPMKLSQPTHAEVTLGLFLSIIGAGFMYALTSVFVKLAVRNGVGPMESLFARCVFQIIFFGTAACLQKKTFLPPNNNLRQCVAITVVYTIATMASFEAFDVIPPGNAITTRGASRTIFSIIFAFLLNRERISIKDTLAVLICLTGMVCIVASSFLFQSDGYYVTANDPSVDINLVQAYGYVLIVSAGVTRGLGMVMVRPLKGELHPFVIVFYHSTLTLLITFVLLFIRPLQWPPTLPGCLYTFAICITSSIATCSSNSAVQLIHPGLVSMGQNVDMILSIVLGHIVFHFPPNFLEIFGACIILTSVTGIAWARWRKSKYESEREQLLPREDD